MSTLAPAFDALLEELFDLQPLFATYVGDHARDDRWPDMSHRGRAERVAFAERWIEAVTALGPLGVEDAIDRDLLIGELDEIRFADSVLRDETWDPLQWVYLLGDGLFGLLSREFASPAVRLASVTGRLEGLPAVLDAAREALTRPAGIGDDWRPIGRFQTERAIRDLPGVADLISEALEMAGTAVADGDEAVRGLLPRLEAAAGTARAAVEAFDAYLKDDVLPRSEGEGRLGPDLFAAKFRHTMRDVDLTPDRILAAAEREYAVVRAEMVRLAAAHWSVWHADVAAPADETHLVRGVLDAIAAEHPAADDLLTACRDEVDRIRAFCEAERLIAMTDEPLEIRWTPVFMRSFAGASLSTPGPLDRDQKAFFSITPPDPTWTVERQESFLRELNDRMIRLLTIHEAIPGHYLQMAAANRVPSRPRAIFKNGLFAEGWAVYVTQVMMDAGYGADDPGLLLTHWKFYLRAVVNAIIDIRIHTAGMTAEEAVGLMVDGGFQEVSEATAKYDRARLSSTQLCTYFVGSMSMWDIERDARRRAALDDTIDHAGLPGGFPETRGFDRRAHLASVIAHGAPPPSLLRRILFG